MPAPDKLRIPYEDFDGGRFTHVGRYGPGNQFMGHATYASKYLFKSYHAEEITPDGKIVWREHSNAFAVLHRFDAEGNHLGTDVVRLDGTAEPVRRDWASVEGMIGGLDEVEYGDIWVKPFRVEIDGVVHGLIYEHEFWEQDGAEIEWVMLEPNDIMFRRPWDSGEYST